MSDHRTFDLDPDRLINATDEFRALLDERLPRTYVQGDPPWEVYSLALLERMVSLANSIGILGRECRETDALILLRSLFEYSLMHCWISIHPENHYKEWVENAKLHRSKLHNDTSPYGFAVLDDDLANEYGEADEMKRIAERAQAVDRYWPTKTAAFRSRSGDSLGLLTYRGLYASVYRTASDKAHAGTGAVDEVLEGDETRVTIRRGCSNPSGVLSLAVPLVTLPMVASASLFDWPDESTVTDISDRYSASLGAGGENAI